MVLRDYMNNGMLKLNREFSQAETPPSCQSILKHLRFAE